MKKLQDYIKESEQWVESPAAGDDFAINIREECLVESYIVDVEDGIVLAADDKMIEILESYGMLEDQVEEQLNELNLLAPRSAYIKTAPDQFFKASWRETERLSGDPAANSVTIAPLPPQTVASLGLEARLKNKSTGAAKDRTLAPGGNIGQSGPLSPQSVTVVDLTDPSYNRNEPDAPGLPPNVKTELYKFIEKQGGVAEGDMEESALQAYLGKKKYGTDGMKALQQAGREGASKEKMAKIRAQHDKSDADVKRLRELAGMPVTETHIEENTNWVDDLYYEFNEKYDLPQDIDDDSYLSIVEKFLQQQGIDPDKIETIGELFIDMRDHEEDDIEDDGQPSSYEEYQDLHGGDDWDQGQYDDMDEAKYQGREVPLGKPMQGDVKKFKVYVKDPKTGNVKKVNFGDPNMRIKKSNPARRKSFRARHNCANPGPRTKARYWSCRKW